ncbi:MAG: hypothetical protein CMO80_05330 [Verrucomicrobiales bacterium]|nr:hypothetical protein [Verrucomicrobiales bacterium]
MRGGLWASVVGDVLGVPVEFMDRGEVQANPVTGMRGFGTHNQPAGTWSDDSSLLITTARPQLSDISPSVVTHTHSEGVAGTTWQSRFVRD